MRTSGWHNRSVLLTGHTGFKGGWLTLWLHQLGAKVHGYAIEPPTRPSLFEVARIGTLLSSDTRADLVDLASLHRTFEAVQPEVVFHLAAQSLVREGYRRPLDTLMTNVIGTANLLEAIRASESVGAVVVVTTDKVYENRNWIYPYRESEPLGGHDPYSASKAAAELVTASYRASFFGVDGRSAHIATARAGNVIGGGDWAVDRLVPDCLSAFSQNEPARLRYPHAVRPWQHVLEPLSGYLELAQRLLEPGGQQLATAWNFGPDPDSDATAEQVAGRIATLWGEDAQFMHAVSEENPHEAGLLRLDSSRARSILHWRPRWNLHQALAHTVAWHRAWLQGAEMRAVSGAQIEDYAAAIHA